MRAVTVRLERGGCGREQSAALTERFVEAMDAEHRQMGISDPTLGKQVRRMVAALARRVGEWRVAVAGEGEWEMRCARAFTRQRAGHRRPAARIARAGFASFGSGWTRGPTPKSPMGKIDG